MITVIHYEFLKDILEKMLSVCDGAKAEDSLGFNKGHAEVMFKHHFKEYWKQSIAQYVYDALRLYRKQLKRNWDIEYDKIPYPNKGDERVEMEYPLDFVNLKWDTPKEVVFAKSGETWQFSDLGAGIAYPKGFWGWYNNGTCPKEEKKAKLKSLYIGFSSYGGWHLSKAIKISDKPLEPEKIMNTDALMSVLATEKLFPFQINHTLNLTTSLLNYNVALDSSDTGTGKTYSALASAYNYFLEKGIIGEITIVVLCPIVVIPAWLRAIKHFNFPDNFTFRVVNYELMKLGKVIKYRDSKVKIKGVIKKISFKDLAPNILIPKKHRISKWDDYFEWNLDSERSLIIFDEAHKCKNRKTKVTNLLSSAVNCKMNMLMLSATIAEDPLRMYAIGYALDLFIHQSHYFNWSSEYGCGNDGWGWKFLGNRKDMEKLNLAIGDKMSRMKRSEIEDFPESLILPQLFNMGANSKKIQKVYEELKESLLILRAESIGATSKLTERLKARQAIELLKIPTLVELTENHLEEKSSVVIFVNFRETLARLATKLKTNCIIQGGQSKATNEANRMKFQNNESNIIICNIQAANLGLDLHDLDGNFPRVALISPNDSAQMLMQVLGRVWRAGGKTKSVQYIVFADGTVEEEICDNFQTKIDNINGLNDED
ncbi:MAG: helicase-related protein, partial [Promethearchaeota archaeon]